MIGIIGAMEIEIGGLAGQMTDKKAVTAGKLTMTAGKIDGRDVAVCRCGIGKTNAAAATAFMLTRFPEVELIINLGVAGGIKPGIRQGDIVVAAAAVQHDYDQTPDGLKKGQLSGYDGCFFASDPAAVQRMEDVLSKLGFTHYTGAVATGDQFISAKEKASELYRDFGAFACEMETAAIAHTCDLFGAKFLGVRAVSDNADGGAVESFYSFVKTAAERSIAAVRAFLRVG
jgi:adenosylhomocysteine nucleosidase